MAKVLGDVTKTVGRVNKLQAQKTARLNEVTAAERTGRAINPSPSIKKKKAGGNIKGMAAIRAGKPHISAGTVIPKFPNKPKPLGLRGPAPDSPDLAAVRKRMDALKSGKSKISGKRTFAQMREERRKRALQVLGD